MGSWIGGCRGHPSTGISQPVHFLPPHLDQAAVQRALFLGVDASGAPVFAIDVADGLAPAAAALASAWLTGGSATGAASGGGEWKAARSLELSAFEGSLAATAVGLAQVRKGVGREVGWGGEEVARSLELSAFEGALAATAVGLAQVRVEG